MRRNGVFALVVLTAVLSMGPICDGSATPEEACTNLCECLAFFPAEREQCQDECLSDVSPQISQECLDCVADAECIDIESGRACRDECAVEEYNRFIGENP